MTTTDLNDIFGETIHAYTRAQAIADGYLVDVSETSREAASKFQSPSPVPPGLTVSNGPMPIVNARPTRMKLAASGTY